MAIDRIPGVGPQNSDIAAAVAAPSAATIASTVAGSVPTLAQINTAVANNASPYGGTWANLGTYSTTGTNTVTFSNLSGYKYLRLFFMVAPASNTHLLLRFNGSSAANYKYAWNWNNSGNGYDTNTAMQITPNTSALNYGVFQINGSNSTSVHKHLYSLESGSASLDTGFAGVWEDTSAITSMTLFTSGATWNVVYMNLIGAN